VRADKPARRVQQQCQRRFEHPARTGCGVATGVNLEPSTFGFPKLNVASGNLERGWHRDWCAQIDGFGTQGWDGVRATAKSGFQ
jgi:hypothetical protein